VPKKQNNQLLSYFILVKQQNIVYNHIHF